MSPWIWAIGALVVALLELHAPGCYLIWVALGGAITAIASFTADLSLPAQIGTFVAASLLSCIAGYFVYQRLIKLKSNDPRLNERGTGMIGMKGVVAVAMENGRGKVKLGDSLWLAEGHDLPEGAQITVKNVRGTTVIVEPTAHM
jgi:membrane protein implicated in regulation of membrane protease activity